jgi:hypothetical protein
MRPSLRRARPDATDQEIERRLHQWLNEGVRTCHRCEDGDLGATIASADSPPTLELSRGCNGVQGATATLALTATLAI